MFARSWMRLGAPFLRRFSTTKQRNFKVTVCGANGGIGQPLSLLLKLDSMVSALNLYDIKGTPGVAADLSHVDTCSDVTGFLGLETLVESVYGVDIVVICAGVPRKPGMTREDLFDVNAQIVAEIVDGIGKSCGRPLIAVISNPVNSLVPIAAEILKQHDKHDPNRLFGVSNLDVVRARTFIGEAESVNPRTVKCDVVCGHSGITIIPVLSQSKPKYTGDPECLTKRIQDAGTAVVEAKAGAGSATLAMAYAGAIFVHSLMRGLQGEENVIECAFVESCVCEATDYFATPLCLGKNGLEENLGLPKLNKCEQEMMKEAIPLLQKSIQKGVEFVKNMSKEKKCSK